MRSAGWVNGAAGLASFSLIMLALVGWQAPPGGQPSGAGAAGRVHADRTLLPPAEDAKVTLGKALFFDADLSEPNGQSCSSCHSPSAGFTDPDHRISSSEGVMAHRFGSRNAPTAAYAAFTPPFHFDQGAGRWVGGQFLDGRAADLVAQAQGPFVNPIEMHNESKYLVVRDVARQPQLAELFRYVYGPDSLDAEHADEAYVNIADAIAAFEGSPHVNRFSSRFDDYVRGQGTLTDQELTGFALFNGKANCFSCHSTNRLDGVPGPLFTNHTYENIGTPSNRRNPFLFMPPGINPDGRDYIDVGLYATVLPLDADHAKFELGKFRVPTLRNVALTAPYGHNGYFKTLKDIVHFYNTRDLPEANWPRAEIPQTMNRIAMGNLGLTDEEEDAIVAFMLTLTDE